MENKILNDLQLLFQIFFNDNTLILTPQTTASDVLNWDSFNHIQLMYLVEEKFKIKFSVFELADLNNIGDLVTSIEYKLA